MPWEVSRYLTGFIGLWPFRLKSHLMALGDVVIITASTNGWICTSLAQVDIVCRRRTTDMASHGAGATISSVGDGVDEHHINYGFLSVCDAWKFLGYLVACAPGLREKSAAEKFVIVGCQPDPAHVMALAKSWPRI